MLIQQNEKGEIKGYGAEYVCVRFGDPGHDYQHCRVCYANYERHLAALAVSAKAGTRNSAPTGSKGLGIRNTIKL